jgi:hypothetical protein
LTASLVPVHAWHHRIKQDEVRRLFLGQPQAFLAVGRPSRLIALLGKHHLNEISGGVVIVNDQD